MDRVFANFHIDNDFYIMLFLFLLITIIISTLIVVFVTKIHTLSIILEQAKKIDRAKEERLSFLNRALNNEKIDNIKLKEDLKYLENSKKKLQNSEKTVSKLQEQIIEQEKEHLDELYEKKTLHDKLKIHYRITIEQLEKAEEELFIVKRMNEELTEQKSLLYRQNRELKMKFSGNQKHSIKKINMINEHQDKFKDEFTQLTSKLFKANPKEFNYKRLNK
ncbi:DNA recombination protein RmuC [hydrothermal vent metagenome]|uniref:DNA recombination protein RmuC n=1 Tax=hydrothermal vent metagenome TaxID=652676 RepID=A0A1W1BUP0_9ZZZZ